ncbi:thiolase [Protomyces lactucae-debilis]|uniref:Thiolase n=1 Tax=Protomyces lactucae-debilis TaxID=2754530 RepID=A0A1Y2F0E8_PROLT|nr:thiolase [Protomyces lactucae-debilis]ORY77313.1 thiolase [Protomyces lactucae-debilis]
MASRLQQIASHVGLGKTAITSKSNDDIVIVSALRTPITRAKKGGFKDTNVEDLLAGVLKATLDKTGIDPKLVEDIHVGSVLSPGGGATLFRAGALAAGFPNTTSVSSLNRQCSSGLQAVVQIAHEIQAGMIEIGIGAGAESMTQGYGAGAMGSLSDACEAVPEAADCTMPMGLTSENVAKEFNVSREDQDRFAAESYRRAEAAQKAGLFKEEIAPIRVTFSDPKSGEDKQILVEHDDGIRYGTTYESLAKLKPAFAADGATHAGNASQVSDGAAAVLLMKRSKAKELNLPVIGKYVCAAVVGVPPRIMGVGPAYAIPAALKKAGLSKEDIDIYEINEAFASQALMSCRTIGLDMTKVNPKGGAIAFGHPLGCTGARQIATGLTELKRTGGKTLCVSMCIGTGMGLAGIFTAE